MEIQLHYRKSARRETYTIPLNNIRLNLNERRLHYEGEKKYICIHIRV